MHKMTFRKVLVTAVALAFLGMLPNGDALAKKSPAQKCQKAIDKEAQKLTKKRLKKLFKCGKKKFKGDQDPAACVGEVADVDANQKKIQKACPTDVITGPASENALGFKSCASRALCQRPTDAASLASCVSCSQNFEAECLFLGVYNKSTAECQAP
jgi:hypothetical protein